MDTAPFDITYRHNGREENAIIHPCCREDSIVDYAVWQNGKLSFTITRDQENAEHWVVALKNADDNFEEEMIQQIGVAISRHKTV